MPDISNQLNKATGDLATRFTDTTQVTATFAEALDNAAKKLTNAFGDAEESVKRKTRSDKGTKRGPQAKLEKELQKQLGLRVKMEKLLVKGLVGLQKGLVGLVKVGIKGLQMGFDKLKKSFVAMASNVGNMFKKIPGIGKLAAGGPLAALLGVATLLVKQLLQVSNTIAEISRDTGLVGNNLIKMKKSVIDATAGLHVYGIGMKEVGKQASALVDSLGNANLVTAKLLDVTSRVAKATGMSAQESANLATNLIRGFGKTAPQIEKFTESIMNFATRSGVNARKVMRDIANDSNLTAIYLSRGEDYMAKTAIMAAKMGKSMAENMATTDVFLDIEAGSDVVGKLNNFFGGNLNSLKMYNMAIKQDTIGVMKELNKVISTPQGLRQLERYPGIAKQLASQLNLNIKDFRNMGRVIKELETAAKGPTKEQETLNKFIYESMTLWEKIQGIIATMVLPMFTQLGSLADEKLKPAMEIIAGYAKSFAIQINEAMGKADTFGKKLKAAFEVIFPHLRFMFDTLGKVLGGAIARGMWQSIKNSPTGRWIMQAMAMFGGAWAGLKVGAAIGGGVGALAGGFGGIPGAIIGGGVGAVAGAFGGKAALDYSINATGNVHSRPTLALVGEEGRSEVVIPTERIRRGMPVNSRVASELSSIGVPGFGVGQWGGGPSAAGLTATQNTVQQRARQSMVYSSQGDPQAIKRREQQIEIQAAAQRADQRQLVNKIMKEQKNLAEEEYFRDDSRGGGGGGGGGAGTRPTAPGGKNFWKRLHDFSKNMDLFLKKHNVTYTNLFRTLPLKMQEPIEEAWAKLPEKMQTGLSTGLEVAWDAYLKKPDFTEALRAGTAAGIREAYAEDIGRWAPAMAESMAMFVEGKSVEDSIKGGLRVAFDQPGGFINTWITDNQKQAATAQKTAEGGMADKKEIRAHQHESERLQKDIADFTRMGNEATSVDRKDAAAQVVSGSKTLLAENQKVTEELKKARTDMAKGAAISAAKGAGVAGGLGAGMETFLAGGSAGDVAKSALVGGLSAGAGAGITAGLAGMGVPLPVAQMLGSIGGGLVGKGASWAMGKLGMGPKKIDYKGERAAAISVLSQGIEKSKGPGQEDLYNFFKRGSGNAGKLRTHLSKLRPEDAEGLAQEIQQMIYNKTGGVELSAGEVAGFLAAATGKNIARFEQKNRLGAIEARLTTRGGASGAIVNRPTVAIVGERGPEALMPLENAPGARPLGGSGGGLADEIRKMNELLTKVITTPPVVNLDGQRVSKVISTVQSDDIRSGVYTVNSR